MAYDEVVHEGAARGSPQLSRCQTADGYFRRLTIPLALTLALCNMDRIVLSVAMLAIAKEYGFTLAQQVRASVPGAWAAVDLHVVCNWPL